MANLNFRESPQKMRSSRCVPSPSTAIASCDLGWTTGYDPEGLEVNTLAGTKAYWGSKKAKQCWCITCHHMGLGDAWNILEFWNLKATCSSLVASMNWAALLGHVFQFGPRQIAIWEADFWDNWVVYLWRMPNWMSTFKVPKVAADSVFVYIYQFTLATSLHHCMISWVTWYFYVNDSMWETLAASPQPRRCWRWCTRHCIRMVLCCQRRMPRNRRGKHHLKIHWKCENLMFFWILILSEPWWFCWIIGDVIWMIEW